MFRRYSASASAEAKRCPAAGVGSVVQHHAVLEREPALGIERGRGVVGDQAQPELDVAQQLPLAAAPDLRAVGELAGLAEVVDDRRAQQQVAVQARVQRAELERHRGDRDGVLEQAAEIGVVGPSRAPTGAGADRTRSRRRRQRAGRAADLRAQRSIAEQRASSPFNPGS